jgi:CarD family transcriptional regulator
MGFKVGDRVVYPHHGAAIIEKKETKEVMGQKTDYLVLRMAHGEMMLSVPVDKAEEVGMRWPISKEDVEDLFEVLQRRDVREPANWSRRFKNHQEKLKSGDVYQVAEVVRNLALRDRDKGLSAGEKTLFNKARSVLVSELSFALNVTEDDALEKVEAALVGGRLRAAQLSTLPSLRCLAPKAPCRAAKAVQDAGSRVLRSPASCVVRAPRWLPLLADNHSATIPAR